MQQYRHICTNAQYRTALATRTHARGNADSTIEHQQHRGAATSSKKQRWEFENGACQERSNVRLCKLLAFG
eukprot:603721-Alexandrium_andersonii.AAC.1